MTYQETLDWMFGQLPMYQNQGQKNYKIDLAKTEQLARELDHPEQKFKSIHVAGTNGKGSISHMLASILQEAGFKVGLYTSPHLKDFRERIRINGRKVPKNFVVDFIQLHKDFLEAQQCSFFEMTVGMAFDYFAKKSVDIAVIEVGLGGRLDSTNIITPEVSVITNIGLDHTQFLGTTLAAIAGEKAGIIKTDVPVVIGETQKNTKPVFLEVAKRTKSKITFADAVITALYPSDLKGLYQKKNQQTVLQTIRVLKDRGWVIPVTAVQEGLKQVIKNTGLLGRWQQIGSNPKVICDTGHNREGIQVVMQQLQQENYQKLHVVSGRCKR